MDGSCAGRFGGAAEEASSVKMMRRIGSRGNMGITSRGLTWPLEVKCMTIARRAGCGEEPGPTCLRPSNANSYGSVYGD